MPDVADPSTSRPEHGPAVLLMRPRLFRARVPVAAEATA
jgi:hypothetical protein